MWFDSWSGILRVVLVGLAAYVWLVLVLRISGKRTLAKLNAFDLVITVALGSTFATILLNNTVAWSEGATALAFLAAAQYLVAVVATKVNAARAVVTGRPTLVVRDGQVLPTNLKGQRVTEAEVRQSVRAAGLGDLGGVAAVVLETDGTMSVIPVSDVGDRSALRDVDAT